MLTPHKRYAYFEELPLKTQFSLNGNRCIKTSTRTAELTEYNRRFYFRRRELCVVNDYCRLEREYFSRDH